MVKAFVTGLKRINGADIGKEAGLAIVAGVVSAIAAWYVDKKLKEWQASKANG